MRIAIYGAGGLGAYYGARLHASGHEVGFIARGAHLEAMRSNGLQVFSPLGDVHVMCPLASDKPADIGAVDLVIVAVKTWQIAEVARAMAPLLHEHTLVVPFLNGVEAPDGLASVIGADRVLGGLSKIFALIEAPGVIRHFSEAAYVEIGEPGGGASARVDALRELFRGAGVEAGVSADIRSALWHKLLMVSSWAGLGALARSPMGVMRAQAETRALIGRAMDEGIAVGRARTTSRRSYGASTTRCRSRRPRRCSATSCTAARPNWTRGTAPSCVSAPNSASTRRCTRSRTTPCCRWSGARARARERVARGRHGHHHPHGKRGNRRRRAGR
jgi:2-dehydropantoate 2-reductase